MNGPSNSALIPVGPAARGKQLRDLTLDALALFKKKKFNPLEELINCYEEVKDLAEDIHRDDQSEIETELQAKRLKFDIIKEIAQYAIPKLRSVEHTGQVDSGITIVLGVQPKEVKTLNIPNTSERLPAFVAEQ